MDNGEIYSDWGFIVMQTSWKDYQQSAVWKRMLVALKTSEAYFNDDVFLSSASSDSLKPKPKTQPEKSTKTVRMTIDYDGDTSILDFTVLGCLVTTTISTSQNRPVTQPTSAVYYDSILEPSTKRKALDQSTSSKAASSSSNRRLTPLLPSLAQVKERPLVDRNRAAESRAGPFNQDDDHSRNADFGYDGDYNDGGMDVDEPEQDPIPESPHVESERQSLSEPRRHPTGRGDGRIERDDGDIPTPDDDGQFDVGEAEEPEPEENPRRKRVRLAKEKKEKLRCLSTILDGPQNLMMTRTDFAEGSNSDTLLFNGGEPDQSTLSSGVHELAKLQCPSFKKIVWIPEAQTEPISKKHRRQGTTRHLRSRNERSNSKQAEVWVENPDEGWDAETEKKAMVIDYETKQEMEKVIVWAAAMLDPKQPLNATYAFQKVFSDGEFVAGNQYYLENISDRDCKLFVAQTRKVTEKMIPSPTKRASMVPAVRDASASQTPRPAARVGPPTGSGPPSKPKKIGTSSTR
ncbi:hypothetical protein FRC04_005441 [Tulasnella sp. 424]|nr:hypothetical protein FRC04_005441 [Tulasnella sp. 424]KAG8964558.1 hypothetical protein FRC05_003767 [Tulasnella sp. 425]